MLGSFKFEVRNPGEASRRDPFEKISNNQDTKFKTYLFGEFGHLDLEFVSNFGFFKTIR